MIYSEKKIRITYIEILSITAWNLYKLWKDV